MSKVIQIITEKGFAPQHIWTQGLGYFCSVICLWGACVQGISPVIHFESQPGILEILSCETTKGKISVGVEENRKYKKIEQTPHKQYVEFAIIWGHNKQAENWQSS